MTRDTLGLDSPEIRACLESMIPAAIASVSGDGTPNVTWLSIMQRLDDNYVGLSRQFFRKTYENIRTNRRLQLLVIHPASGQQYHLDLEHEASETQGPRFDAMKTQLDAVASQSGMSQVFRLQALEVCRVVAIETVPADKSATPGNDSSARSASQNERLHAFVEQLNAASDLDDLISRALRALDLSLGYHHSILLLVDGTGQRLYTVASHGYVESGVGSEVRVGEGYIGICAERRKPVLAANLARDRAYTTGVRLAAISRGHVGELEREIPLPGLANPMSQLAVPMLARDKLLGVLCLQSGAPGTLLSDDEHVASVAASNMGLAMALLQREPVIDSTRWRISVPPVESPTSVVKHYESDDSIFIDDEYLIKGVAGRVLWRVLKEYLTRHRTDFSNKEMRLDQTLQLPEVNDNLEARLILLRRRLADQCPFVSIVRTGRGRFRLNVHRPLDIQELP